MPQRGGTISPKTQEKLLAMFRLWPAVVVAVFAGWMTHPLWGDSGLVFAGKLSTDNIVTPWYYDFVARAVWEAGDGSALEWLHDFDWPNPYPRTKEFPNLLDALLVAPAAWFLDWPQQWGFAQSMAIWVNAIGFAMLARAVGCRNVGIALAGCFGVLCRPLWRELVLGRMNVAWLGLIVISLAAALEVLRLPDKQGLHWKRPLMWGVFAAFMGGASAMIYPPLLVLLVPIGLVLAWGPLFSPPENSGESGQRFQLAGLFFGSLLVGLALAWPELQKIIASQEGRLVCGSVACPDEYHRVLGEHLFRLEPESRQGLSLNGVLASSVVLVPLAFLHKRRKTAFFVLLVVIVSVLMAMGPCPQWAGFERDDGWQATAHQIALSLGGLWAQPWGQELWCRLEPLHDNGRFLAPVSVGLALLSAWGLESVAGQPADGGRPPWWRLVLALLIGIVVVAGSSHLFMQEMLQPTKWHEPKVPSTTEFLKEHVEEPVVELPYDRRNQFFSVLEAPGAPRVNPLKGHQTARQRGAFFEWINDLGRGIASGQRPSAEEVESSGVGWILFDPNRCGRQRDTHPACSKVIVSALTEVLGQGQSIGDDALAWRVSGQK